MTETGIVALAGVAATLLSGLGAAWLTNRSARQRDHDQRASVVDKEIRALLVSIIVAARGWGGGAAGIAAGLAIATSKSQFQNSLLELLNNSTSGKDFARYGDELTTALTEAKLRLNPGPLATAVGAMSTLMLQWYDQVITPMSADLASEHPNAKHRLKIATNGTNEWAEMVATLEEAARLELPNV